jgi:uncharacterized protein YndB with AHSA1/START domain
MTEPGDPVIVERRINARRDTVFSYFTDPARWLQWQGIDAELEAVPGGRLRMNVRGDGYASGTFTVVDPPHRIVFTWGWEMPGNPVPPGSSTIEVDLIDEGDVTLVRLTHRDLPPESRELHTQGWTHYLGRLAIRATGGDPGRDPWIVDNIGHPS